MAITAVAVISVKMLKVLPYNLAGLTAEPDIWHAQKFLQSHDSMLSMGYYIKNVIHEKNA